MTAPSPRRARRVDTASTAMARPGVWQTASLADVIASTPSGQTLPKSSVSTTHTPLIHQHKRTLSFATPIPSAPLVLPVLQLRYFKLRRRLRTAPMSHFLLPAFILLDTARSCVAFAVIQTGVYLPAAQINFWAELWKLTFAVIFHYRWFKKQEENEKHGVPVWLTSLLPRKSPSEPIEWRTCLATAVPASLYLLNNMLYLTGLRFCDPASLNAALQLKLPLTAILHLLVFRRQRVSLAWLSLAVLSLSVLSLHVNWVKVWDIFTPTATIQSEGAVEETAEAVAAWSWTEYIGPLLGLTMAVISSVTAIVSEVLMKTPLPFWSLQIWLYGWGAFFAAVMSLAGIDDSAKIANNVNASIPYHLGYLLVIVSIAFVGIVVANILRKADNLVKLVGSSATICTTFFLQPFIAPKLWESASDPASIAAIAIIALTTFTYNHYKDMKVPGSETAETEPAGQYHLPLHSPSMITDKTGYEAVPLMANSSFSSNEDDDEKPPLVRSTSGSNARR